MIRILSPSGISEFHVSLGDTTKTCEDVKWLYLKRLRKSGELCDGVDEDEALIGILPAFGLVKAENESVYLAPNYVFEEGTIGRQDYKFRVRHRPPSGKIYVENNFLSELFVLQALEDFAKGDLGKEMVVAEVPRRTIIQLALFFFLIPSSLPLRNRDVIGMEYNADKFGIHFDKQFSKEVYNKIVKTKNKLYRKVDHFMYYGELGKKINAFKSKNYSVLYYKTEFIKLVLENYPSYCFERYTAFEPDTSLQVDVSLFQNDSVESKQTPGICINGVRQCGLEAIDSVTLSISKDPGSGWIVELNCRGPKTQDMSLVFEDKDIASSFITMLQGCITLCIRPDVNICQKFTSPFAEIRGKLKSFCPMIHSRAVQLLRNEYVNRAKKECYKFMIYQSISMDLEGHFQVATDSAEPVYHIKYLNGQGFCLYSSSSSDIFPDHLALRSYLIDQYGLGQQLRPDLVLQNINPESLFFVDRKLSTPAPLSIEIDENRTKIPTFVFEEDLGKETDYMDSYDEHLKLRIASVGNEKRVEVLLVARVKDYNEALYTGMAKLARLYRAHPSVVLGFYGPVFAHTTCNSYILEHSLYGNLVEFIKKNFEIVTTHQKMKLALEVVNIFCALTQRAESTRTPRLLHGNIRGRNLWVFKRPDRFYLKLGDPGLVSYYNTLPLDKYDNDQRIPWLSLQRQQNLEEVTVASECYAVATTIAEIFYGTDDFRSLLRCNKDQSLMSIFSKSGFKFPLPEFPTEEDKAVTQIVKNITTEVWKVLTPCWDPDPDNRPSPTDLKRHFLDLVEDSSCIQKETKLEHLKAEALQLHKERGISVQQRINQITSIQECKKYLSDSEDMYYIKSSDVEMDKDPIGNGHYGVVYKGTLKTKDNLKVAIKTFKINPDENSHFKISYLIFDLIKEFRLSVQLEHENIVKSYYWTHIETPFPIKVHPVTHEVQKKNCLQYYMVMEYMNRGKLTTYLCKNKNKDKSDFKTLLGLSLDIAKGMEFCESKGVVHCDLATRNVLLDDKTGRLRAKVSDFGLSKVLQREKDYYYAEGIEGKSLPIYWYPPEYLLFQREGIKSSGIPYTTSGDIWGFGTTLWEIFNHGSSPTKYFFPIKINNKEGLYAFYDDRKRLPQNDVADDIYYIMMQCWKMVPERRPRFAEIREMLFSTMSKYH